MYAHYSCLFYHLVVKIPTKSQSLMNAQSRKRKQQRINKNSIGFSTMHNTNAVPQTKTSSNMRAHTRIRYI